MDQAWIDEVTDLQNKIKQLRKEAGMFKNLMGATSSAPRIGNASGDAADAAASAHKFKQRAPVIDAQEVRAPSVSGGAGSTMGSRFMKTLPYAGVGLAGNIIGKNQGYGTGYDQGSAQGFTQGTTMGYNQGYSQAADQAKNTGFMGRLMNNHSFQPTGPQGPGVEMEELVKMLAQNYDNRPGFLRRLTGSF